MSASIFDTIAKDYFCHQCNGTFKDGDEVVVMLTTKIVELDPTVYNPDQLGLTYDYTDLEVYHPICL